MYGPGTGQITTKNGSSMKTLDLQEAAAFLRMNPETLRRKTKARIIPGAKPGKSWVYVEEDLIDFIRSQYTVPAGQAVRVTRKEVLPCHSTDAIKPGGSASPRRTVKEYEAALGLKTA